MNQSQRSITEGILFTDQYQLTMAQLYFRMGLHEREAQFDHFFRSYPNYGSHQAGYCVNAGLEWVLDWMQTARFGEAELSLMRDMKTNTGGQLFGDDFLAWLEKHGDFGGLTLTAVPEGRIVHGHVPLTIVRGPLAMGQILETPLLNHLNYQTLIATKAARMHQAGRGQLLLEFGMRRGHERGVNAGTRAALIGGADFSSNAGISHLLGYPPRGTHAHALVQLFMALGEGEIGAFRAYADVYPDDCLLLVDTINTLESGVPNAIRVFEELRRKGHEPVGIRLDSGDLAYLAVQSAKLLSDAGFPDTSITLSNDLDEMTITQILQQIIEEAPAAGLDADAVINRLAYGVGTRLITSSGKSALGGVYKLVAVQDEQQTWQPAIKISETPIKTPNPGLKKAWRVYGKRGLATADLLTLASEPDPSPDQPLFLQHPTAHGLNRTLPPERISSIEPLHETVWVNGRLARPNPSIEIIRARRLHDLTHLDAGVKRLINPHIYHVSLSQPLWQLKQKLIREAKNTE